MFLEVFNYPALFIGRIIALVVSLSLHEFAHAFAAYELGDTTAQRAGRLTLNPLAHLDPIGSLMMIFVGFGWARPVPVNPHNLRGNRLRSMAVTAAAGPVSNILQAFIFALPIRFGLVKFEWGVIYSYDLSQDSFLPSLGLLLSLLVWTNLLLAVFNMIPLGPLDGLKVLLGLVPPSWVDRLMPIFEYGSWLLMLLMVFGGGILFYFIYPVAIEMLGLLAGFAW